MNANEAMTVWAKRKLDSNGVFYTANDGDKLTVEERTFSDGYCETCYFEETCLAIVINGETVLRLYESFSEIMEELIKIVQEDK